MSTEIQIQYKVLSLNTKKDNLQTVYLRVHQSNSMHVIHRALTKQTHEKRQGNANCKNRSEIRGGGKKPWKQKGTGRARVGSIRSPLWRGGGVIFGPKTKAYKQKLNRKEKKLALTSLLYNKKKHTIVIDSFHTNLNKPNTKFFLEKIRQLNIETGKKVLIIVYKKEPNTYLSVRNLKNIDLIAANQINIDAIIASKYLLIESKALNTIQQIYNG